MKAVRVHATGGREKLVYEEVQAPISGPGQVRVKNAAIGVNFIDVYYRTGVYRTALPFVPGMEASGVIEDLGAGVSGWSKGDRVAYTMTMGSYADYTLVNPAQLVKLPEGVDFHVGAAAMLQGMTAHYLAFSTYPLRSGETALVHAAAGGVGLLLVQICRMIGAKVIATVSTEAKGELARGAGAEHVILYSTADFESEVKAITEGRGVDVIYDSVGRTTFDKDLNCLRRRGMLVLFGQSSGVVPPFDLNILNAKGSLYVTRPSLSHYSSTPEELRWRAGDVFEWIHDGKLKLRIDRTLPLKEAAKAHEALETRQTSGKILLLP
jgi:NADPH2:quinone reductase